jgi:hypothetical protein
VGVEDYTSDLSVGPTSLKYTSHCATSACIPKRNWYPSVCSNGLTAGFTYRFTNHWSARCFLRGPKRWNHWVPDRCYTRSGLHSSSRRAVTSPACSLVVRGPVLSTFLESIRSTWLANDLPLATTPCKLSPLG